MVRWLTLAVALAFGATPVWAGGHSGGHGGGSHSGGSHSGGSHSGGHGHGTASHASGGTHADGRQAHSGASGHAGDRNRPDPSSDRSSSRASTAPPVTDAERRHPRPGAAGGDRFFDRFHTGSVRPYFGLRYGSSGFFDPFFFDYAYFGGSPWPYDGAAPYLSGGYGDGGGYRGDLGLTAPWERPSAMERDPDRDAGDPVVDRDEEGMDSVFILVHPADASIYVDDVFRGSGREVGRLAVTPGPHRVEVVRPGYRTAVRDFDIRPDDAKDLDIRLTPF
jgi:PEGA domain